TGVRGVGRYPDPRTEEVYSGGPTGMCLATSRRPGSVPRRVRLQRRAVADQPQVSERVDEPALAVHAPGRLVIADLVQAAVGACPYGRGHEGVRVVDEHLDADGAGPERGGGVPAVALRLAEEQRGSLHRHPDDAAQVPQLLRADGVGV